MKKFIILLLILVLATSCRITKSVSMMEAKYGLKMLTAEQFIQQKKRGIEYLNLSSTQLLKATDIWNKERKDLENLKLKSKLKNETIAPVIYQSEIDFRTLLNDEQKKKYPQLNNKDEQNILDYFQNDRQMAELKRIYKL